MEKETWIRDLLSGGIKKPLPILAYPGSRFLPNTIKEILGSSVLQAQMMKQVALRCDAAAAVTPMDLSVEAECFGAKITESEDAVPAVSEVLIRTPEQAQALPVPAVGSGRSGIFIDTVRQAKKLITDRPILAGCVGPFSLVGRLVGVTESMLLCFDEPEMIGCLLEKSTRFLTDYILALKAAGADGVILAEPVTGLLSPSLEEDFSARYIRQLVSATGSDDFLLIYHNCGQNVSRMTASLFSNGCDAYHFGNAVDLRALLSLAPPDKPILGNIDPVACFRDGKPEQMRSAVKKLLSECGSYANFVLSSGCDIPPDARWENIEAFFAQAREGVGEEEQ